MATFALIPGAGDSGWYWHLVVDELRARGHDAVAPDLPADDDDADLGAYADTDGDASARPRPPAADGAPPGPSPGRVVAPIGGRDGPLAVVGQSFGAFTAPLVCERAPAG